MRDSRGNTSELCYISSTVHTLYLSREACEDLGIISKEFPSRINTATLNNMTEAVPSRPCSYPERTLPPTNTHLNAISTNQGEHRQTEGVDISKILLFCFQQMLPPSPTHDERFPTPPAPRQPQH